MLSNLIAHLAGYVLKTKVTIMLFLLVSMAGVSSNEKQQIIAGFKRRYDKL